MKKILSAAFCGLFLLVCIVFALGALQAQDSAEAEGRELAAFPELKKEGSFNTAFFTEFDAWLTDRFMFRQTLVTLNSLVREHVFRTGSDEVIVGKDDFLFLAETAADYTGESSLSDAEIDSIASALQSLSDYADQHGSRLLVAIAPNKNTVYPDRMPSVYRRTEEATNMDRLYAALGERGVLYTDLRETFRDAPVQLYHSRDTHWNSEGARLAYCAILADAGIVRPDYTEFALKTTEGFVGDLDGLLYPSLSLTDQDQVRDFDFSAQFIYTTPYQTAMDMTIATRGRGEGKLLVFRDSFGSALIPYFSSAFSEVRYERALPYRIDLLKQFDAELVIVEIAERNIPLLSSAAERIAGEQG